MGAYRCLESISMSELNKGVFRYFKAGVLGFHAGNSLKLVEGMLEPLAVYKPQEHVWKNVQEARKTVDR